MKNKNILDVPSLRSVNDKAFVNEENLDPKLDDII